MNQEEKQKFESLANGYSVKDKLIEVYLYPMLQKDSLDYLSFRHALESGTISGGLRLALHKMLTSYTAELKSERDKLAEENERLKAEKEGLNAKITNKAAEEILKPHTAFGLVDAQNALEALEEYGRLCWDRACETRDEQLFEAFRDDIPNIGARINNVPKPEFKP